MQTKTVTNIMRANNIDYVRAYRSEYKKGGGRIKLYCCGARLPVVASLLKQNDVQYKELKVVVSRWRPLRSVVIVF